MRRPGSSARGQATVELAIGSTIFVTLLLGGIYLSETSFLGLKVQEAANFASWYSTGLRVSAFQVPGDRYGPFSSVAGTAQREAESRYADYDGRDATAGGGGGTRQTLAEASPIQVRCAVDPAIGFAVQSGRMPNNDGPYPAQVRNLVKDFYQDHGAVRCTASASISTVRVPQHYLDSGGGFFHDALFTRGPIPLCGAGRARGGQCKGSYAMLVGDWGMDGPPGDKANGNFRYLAQGDNVNKPLYEMAKQLWEADGRSRGDHAAVFAAQLSVRSTNPNRAPYREDQFLDSYAGYEHFDIDMTPPGYYVDDTTGTATPGSGFVFATSRGNCFLGRNDGCTAPTPNQSF